MLLIKIKSLLEYNRRFVPMICATQTLILCCIFSVSCTERNVIEPLDRPDLPEDSIPASPLFQNSIVSTDIDFIMSEDSSAFLDIQYIGQSEQEMPDRRNDVLMDASAYVFEASFSGGKTVGIYAHSSFGSLEVAEKYAQMLSGPLGKLPEVQRSKLSHVIIHKGDETAFGESEGHFFVLYSQNMETRIRNHDLEETVFHESVHATLETIYQNDEDWLKAQAADGTYITDYAKSLPNLEDLPETAIFAYTMIEHPGRLSPEIEEWVHNNIPNRFEFFKTIYK